MTFGPSVPPISGKVARLPLVLSIRVMFMLAVLAAAVDRSWLIGHLSSDELGRLPPQ